MTTSDKQLIPLSRLVPLPNNPRKITQADLNRLCDSIRDNGYWEHRPAAVEPIEGTDRFTVLDGNQRLKALRRMKRKEMPCVIYTGLTDEKRNDIILRSNINNGQWEFDTLQTEFDGVDFEDIGLHFELPEPPQVADTPDDTTEDTTEDTPSDTEPEDDNEPEGLSEDRLAFFYRMMGDYLYPTDNEFEIPVLLTDNQPVHIELPFTPWGVEGRHKKGITTYHFYVDDYRFEQLFKNPILLLQSGCRSVVEPNCSIHDQTPVAYGIYLIYRKRYLARYLQECGIQVWADLNVSPRFEEYNRLGIPDGYNAFFTRGVTGWIETLERHWDMAQRISGLEHPNMCVYGGGRDIEEWCQKRSIRYLAEFINKAKKIQKGIRE